MLLLLYLGSHIQRGDSNVPRVAALPGIGPQVNLVKIQLTQAEPTLYVFSLSIPLPDEPPLEHFRCPLPRPASSLVLVPHWLRISWAFRMSGHEL